MPQLNSATFVSQIFWLIISFMIMWLVVSRFVAPKISEIVKRRQRKIDDCISAAEDFKSSAEELISRYNSAIEKAEKQADETWQKTNDELKKQFADLQEEMNERLQKKMSESKDDLRRIEQTIKSRIDIMAADLSEELLQKLNIPGIGREEIDEILKEDAGNE